MVTTPDAGSGIAAMGVQDFRHRAGVKASSRSIAILFTFATRERPGVLLHLGDLTRGGWRR